MITQTNRLATGQTFLTMALMHSIGGLVASVREVPEDRLREWSGMRDATQFFATQLSLSLVIEHYLGNASLKKSFEDLIDIPDEYEEEDDDSFSLNLSPMGDESDSERREQLLQFDLGPQMIHVAGEFIRRHSDHLSSVFTPGIYQGEHHGSLPQILEGLKKTIAFIESNWPAHMVDMVKNHAIGDYDAANAFLTPSDYLEGLRGRKKVSPKITKREVGTIPQGAFLHEPPIGAALSQKMKYMAPIYMILSSIENGMVTMGLNDESSLREFEELKDGLLNAAGKIDTFLQHKTS